MSDSSAHSTINSSSDTSGVTELAPSFRIPGVLVLLGSLLFWALPWVGGAIALLGLLLLFQTLTLRLRFTDSALDIYRGEQRIRQFPYAEWLNWEIYWQPVPILLYFKEVNSIHFLPIIFNPAQLRSCLERHIPRSAESA